MKAYMFDTETGLYEGETYEEADMLHNEDGITPVPPPQYSHSQIPVFDRSANDWTVISTTVARQLLRLDDEADTRGRT